MPDARCTLTTPLSYPALSCGTARAPPAVAFIDAPARRSFRATVRGPCHRHKLHAPAGLATFRLRAYRRRSVNRPLIPKRLDAGTRGHYPFNLQSSHTPELTAQHGRIVVSAEQTVNAAFVEIHHAKRNFESQF